MIISQKEGTMTSKKNNFTDIHVQMDNLIENHKSVTEVIERFMQIRDRKIKDIEDQCEEKVALLNKELLHIETQLRMLADQVPQKETKTQYKVDLLAGSIVIKKPKQKPKPIEVDKLIEWAKENAYNDYYKEEVVVKLQWNELKKDIQIVDGQPILVTTGEVLEGVSIEDKPEEVVIK